METKHNDMSLQNSIMRVALGTGAILLIPLVMTILNGRVDGAGWNWTLSDFIIMGILISGTVLMIELVRHKVRNKNHRIGLIVALVFGLLWLWVELAVGLFTNWGS